MTTNIQPESLRIAVQLAETPVSGPIEAWMLAIPGGETESIESLQEELRDLLPPMAPYALDIHYGRTNWGAAGEILEVVMQVATGVTGAAVYDGLKLLTRRLTGSRSSDLLPEPPPEAEQAKERAREAAGSGETWQSASVESDGQGLVRVSLEAAGGSKCTVEFSNVGKASLTHVIHNSC